MESMTPTITPTSPPMLVRTTASVRNCPNIAPFPAPIAFFRPISDVRSVTDTSMIFITPIPPTRRDIPAIHISIIFVDCESCCICFACSSRSCALYSVLPSDEAIDEFKISCAAFPAAAILSAESVLSIRFCGSSYR